MAKAILKKGENAEEKLRLYFLSLGYFVVRSIDAEFRGFSVTDIDLFLYSRPSPISRERTNVDVKMKVRPQALERVFWTKGLREVLGFEKCIVATTDKRSHVGEFGAINDVLVLDGNFMSKLDSTTRYAEERLNEERLNEEDFLYILSQSISGKGESNWKKQYELSKSNLIYKSNYDGLNELLNRIKEYMEQICSGHASESCYRVLYITLAFFLVTLDYTIKDVSYKDQKERAAIIEDGIRFGEKGRQKSEEVVAMSTAFMGSFMNANKSGPEEIKNEVYAQFNSIPADYISNYFGTAKMMKRLLPLAIEIEVFAFNKHFLKPSCMSSEIQSVIGLLCDFHSLDRKIVLA